MSKIYSISVNAESKKEAVPKLQELAQKLDPINFWGIEEKNEPTNWHNLAENEAEIIFESNEKEIDEAIKKEIGTGKDDVDVIFHKIYQQFDVNYWTWESADGNFIYNSNDALCEALDCLSDLGEFEETDSGLWDSRTNYWDIINIKATYTLGNAIYSELEDKIKSRIETLLSQNTES